MARILAGTRGLPREEWLALRRRGIGGSDAPAVLGLSPFTSRLELYADKRGELPERPQNEAMRLGRDLEAYVARRWEEAEDKRCRRRNAIFQHDTLDFAMADPDRLVVGENAGLECKTTSYFRQSELERGEIPLRYYVQCTHYMAVMGFSRMYLSVLVLGRGIYNFVIERNEEEIAALLKAEQAFWEEHVLRGVPPEPDGSESAAAALRALYPAAGREAPPAVLPCEAFLDTYMRLQDEIHGLQRAAETEKQKVMLAMGAAAAGVTRKYRVTWTPQRRTVVDREALREKYPEAYGACAKTAETRVLRVARRGAE